MTLFAERNRGAQSPEASPDNGDIQWPRRSGRHDCKMFGDQTGGQFHGKWVCTSSSFNLERNPRVGKATYAAGRVFGQAEES
jgi:hypothetical protein